MATEMNCDLVVVGSGAAGLATAITARKRGLDVIVLEKEPVFGGTTALSGGVLWVPLNKYGRQQNPADTVERVREYMMSETGSNYDAAAVQCFIENGPKMVDFFERETEMKFVPTLYPDYHPDAPGGVDIGRSILAAPYDIRGLGKDMQRLKPPLETITFMGMMFNSSNADLKHFFRATKSVASFFYVAKRLATHIKELALYGRGTNVTSGNALAARLAKSALALDIPILTSTPVKELLSENGKVVRVRAAAADGELQISARHGVVLACGGFPHDLKRIAQVYPHLKRGGEHLSPTPVGNTGDGLTMAEKVGGTVQLGFPDASAWMPVSKVPFGKGRSGVFPHLLDRYKPGVIGVLRNGQRFTNESNSYHDVGAALMRACEGERETAMWLICDKVALGKYGLGYAKPSPMPVGPLLRNGYLTKGDTIGELARNCGIAPDALEMTIRSYNRDAVRGEDPAFRRGNTSFNRYLADPDNKPNPCVAPISTGPFYAVKVLMGDLGTFDGIKTSVTGEVLRADGSQIDGLYAVGNDRRSMMGGNYPGAGITHGPNMTFGYVTGNTIATKAMAGKSKVCA
ncbi:FAD-dependent oxidoreductase [Comamonas thiooxydans]|uniref:FAD-dependent oxidoreductase n=1 Tax=Comamonas thiooxydans TaxID=363952 RepID=A0AA42Q512_9BURK|nr:MULTISPECIES: FAD-dependent oxidoreductase [Comamonas]EFI62518.1 putative succinate dehydrogenase [Comamonas thiooxydans]MDH1337378.1 FAD-dependent oxidoreductase [Comamonas thiooxydans]MDH1743490.1 FAD-dependent oxidoreductase [Comamonas thiooxydans]MDH1789844.1 FAD-dependent oxidoreductase [Comamonas thiooxydans]TFF54918.1 FAD-dependent oxidoreductase [Comamonas sp. A23]